MAISPVPEAVLTICAGPPRASIRGGHTTASIVSENRRNAAGSAATLDSMELNLNGKSALVTGGSKGIGLAIATVLAAEGARVVVGSRRESPEVAELAQRHDIRFVCADLATRAGTQHLVEEAVRVNGGLDILVNNVGASEPAASAVDFDDEQWQRIFDVTLFSAVRTVRAAVPHLKERPGAAIVTVSSLNAKLPNGVIAPYSAAKAALSNVSKVWAEDLIPQGVRVNAVSPGPVRTPMWTGPEGFAHLFAEHAEISPEEVMDRLLPESMAITTGRVNEPGEVADLVAFLVSERAANIAGVDYVIDGGMLKTAA